MFVRYQKVRNRVLGAFAAVGATVGAIFGFQSMSNSGSTDNEAGQTASSSWQETDPTPRARATPQATTAPVAKANPYKTTRRPSPSTTATLQSDSPLPQENAATTAAELDQEVNDRIQREFAAKNNRQKPVATNETSLHKDAMVTFSRSFHSHLTHLAHEAKIQRNSGARWVLEVHDDDFDLVWDFARFDRDGDGKFDEQWDLNNGRWEREGGSLIWLNGRWQSREAAGDKAGTTDHKVIRYRAAMQRIKSSGANEKAEKWIVSQVLGHKHPWNVNVYDDNRDGQWDRAKLDFNRDGILDEKWTFKNNRWEKNGGEMVWDGSDWMSVKSMEAALQASADPILARYRAAFKIANARADSSGKGKDVLGSRSPWKLNLYDENRDGQWDRAKLDTNRDEVDDEKWTFKNSRWEKDGGSKVWAGDRWESVKAISSAIKKSSNPQSNRYRLAMKIAGGKANGSGKGKDVLGSSSPWKLNLYDDDRNGTWDRAKLDKNRDEVDDEKWNFKDGRWEKDGGASIWDGGKWIKAR